jgi:lambda family phage portal protein
MGRLRNLFRSKKAEPVSLSAAMNRRGRDSEPEADVPLNLRRWPVAKTDRLNKGHWSPATGQTINVDLSSYHETLRTRAEHEIATNSDLEGMIQTFVTDVVGDDGPTLQVQSSSEAYNEWLEGVWRKWWAMPDLNGQLSGVDLLDLWLRTYWSAGEYLAQIVTANSVDGPVKARLLTLHPRRLATPPDKAGNVTIFMGVQRNKTGKPQYYMIAQETQQAGGLNLSLKYDPIKARDIIHRFDMGEAGQVRGVPWIASALQAIADLADYDNEVLDAARAAADWGVLLKSNNPEATPIELSGSVDVERRTMRAVPTGWEPWQMQPNQPSTQYNDFHDEKLRSAGRARCIPLMMIKLDARKHNYSSARFDSQVYVRAINKLRAKEARLTLNRLVDLVATEAGRGIGEIPNRPEDATYHWNWPGFPHVDTKKEAEGTEVALRSGVTCLRDACADRGKDWQDVIAQRGREHEALEAAGLLNESTAPVESDEKVTEDDAREIAEEVAEERLALVGP